MSTQNTMFYIGNESDLNTYDGKNIEDLPIKNLPMAYFPFYYNTNESSVEKMRRLVPLLENHSRITSDKVKGKAAENTIDTDLLFSLLAKLEDPQQPFNNNNATHITYFIIIVWCILLLIVLQILQYWIEKNYIFVVGVMIFIVLIIAVVFALFVTNTVIS